MKKQENYKSILDKYYDSTKTNTQNAKDLENVLGLSVSRGRRVVANYIRNLDLKSPQMVTTTSHSGPYMYTIPANQSETVVAVEDIETVEQLLQRSQVDLEKFKIRSQKIDKSVSGKLGLSVTLDAVDETDYRSEVTALLEEWKRNALEQSITYNIQKPELEDDNLLVINCFDVHFGKVSSPEITGQVYNLEVAKRIFFETIYKIAAKAFYRYGISEIVLCTGGDFFNTDTEGYTTTGGTPQHGDGTSYHKLFTEGCNTIINTLEMLAGFCKKVTFVNVNGNHDRMSSYYLGEVVRTYFSKSPIVHVDNSPSLRKYYSFGENCFMFTHGDKATDKLPLVFAREYKQFSAHQYPNIFLGHFHRTDKKFFGGETEFNGINVRTFNSISAPDTWHVNEGYVESIRKADGLIYSRNEGKIGEINQVVK